jgi:hypothetical protein
VSFPGIKGGRCVGHTHLDGGITFTADRTAIVGPNNHWAARRQDLLIIWPTLFG